MPRRIRFKPEGVKKIANAIGYTGAYNDTKAFKKFLNENPEANKKFKYYEQEAMKMAKGGMIPTKRKYQTGGQINPNVRRGGSPTGAPQSGMQRPQVQHAGVGAGYVPHFRTQQTVRNKDNRREIDLSDAQVTAVDTSQFDPPQTTEGTTVQDETIKRVFQPSLPFGAVVTPEATKLQKEQFVDRTSGQVTGRADAGVVTADTNIAAAAGKSEAAKIEAAKTGEGVAGVVETLDPAKVAEQEAIVAQEQNETAVSNIQAAQGTATVTNNEIQRDIQEGELISGVADAEKAAAFTEQVQAATATPSEKATVQGQLGILTDDFDAANPPAWAAGALRAATAKMAQRGLGASSIAGQAIIQATLEAATPIAAADAATVAQFEQQNLSNRQQRAMLAAEQRATFMGLEFTQEFQARVQNASKISDVANMNFTADQQIQLENSRNANTMNLTNLSNSQAVVMAEAASIAQLEAQNLNNRQQAAVQNANNFLQVDMTNASMQQQTELFKSQQLTQAIFTDAAAENAASQFNATSENQTNQFFAQLQTQTNQFNATQANAQNQFNAGEINTTAKFNQEIANQRDQFNAKNQLIIDQSNAVWRRNVATAATATANRANELNAKAILDMSNSAYNNLWNHYGDILEFAHTSAENEFQRNNALAIAELTAQSRSDIASENRKGAAGSAIGGLIGTLGSAVIGSGFFSDMRLKENIKLIKRLDSGIGLFKWEWNDIAIKLGLNSKRVKGVIAQDIMKYMPELVFKDKNTGYYKVNTWKALLT